MDCTENKYSIVIRFAQHDTEDDSITGACSAKMHYIEVYKLSINLHEYDNHRFKPHVY
jgi:hypothetical protein